MFIFVAEIFVNKRRLSVFNDPFFYFRRFSNDAQPHNNLHTRKKYANKVNQTAKIEQIGSSKSYQIFEDYKAATQQNDSQVHLFTTIKNDKAIRISQQPELASLNSHRHVLELKAVPTLLLIFNISKYFIFYFI